MEKYLDGMDGIRELQELILARAEAEGVPVLESTTTARTADALVDLVLERCELLEALLVDSAPWGSEAEDELGVLGHSLRGPRRLEGELRFDLLDPG